MVQSPLSQRTPENELTDIIQSIKSGDTVRYARQINRINPVAYYFLESTGEKCTKQVNAALKAGLVKIVDRKLTGEHRIEIA